MCRYDEDGALFNFIRDTETNTSCPCVESQARLDLGRFMPHPRCSQVRKIKDQLMKRWVIPVIPWYHLHIDDWFEELLHECTEHLRILCGRWDDIQQSRHFVSLPDQKVQRSKINSSFQSVHDSLRSSMLLRREWIPHADSISTSYQDTKGLLLQSWLSNESLRIWYCSVHGTVRGEIQ